MHRSALLLFLCVSVAAVAQSPLGTVTGLASDPSDSPIPNVAVRLKNQNTGIERQASTNSTGLYTFANLAPGDYKLTAEAKGFRPVESPVFPVAAYRTIRQDLKFEVATASTEVTIVDSVSPVIQTESPAINATLTTKQIIDLPTNLRGIYNNSGDSGLIFQMMPLTIPGILQVGNGAKWLVPGSGATGMKLKVDGIETNFGNFGSPDSVSQPSPESIQEFTANILTNRAEFGGMGTVTTVTRAGSNPFHGSVFWYLRNSALDARNAFSAKRTFQNVHNYGATMTGPIKKDKTFFLFTYDGTRGVRVCATCTFNANVPTLAMRNGDFTGMAALRNPFTGVNPFNGNTIKPEFISPQAVRAQQIFFPTPNYGAPDLTAGNYRAALNAPEVHRSVEGRIDQNFTSSHAAFLRYQNKESDYDIPGARSALPPSSVGTSYNVRRVHFWTAGDTYSISPNLFNEFRAGVVVLVSQSTSDVNGRALLDKIGVGGLPYRTGESGVPAIDITGITSVRQTLLEPVNDGHWQLGDNLTWVKGRHTAKFGVEAIRWFVNRYQPTLAGLFGQFSFTNRFTGNPYADFLLGLPTQVTRLDPTPTQYNRSTDLNFYAQDDFKVTSRLTLSYGLRYEYNGPAAPLDGNMYSFDVASGSIVIPSDKSKQSFSKYLSTALPLITAGQLGLGDSLRKTDKNNWAPRFGFSWQATPKTVLRGGWGVFYSHLSAQIPNTTSAGPFTASTFITNSITADKPLLTFGDPFGAAGAVGTMTLTAVSPRLLNSYAQQYSLSIEREIGHDIGLRVSYIGSKGSQLIYLRNVNQPLPSTVPFAQSRRPYPFFSVINYADNGANMLYSGLQTQVQKRFSKGLLFSSAWTWAMELSDVDDTGGFELNTSIENAYDRRRDRGNVYSVPRHQWMNQFLYELPGKGKLLGGWQLNFLLNLQSGNWLTPVFSGSDPSNTSVIGGRPDLVKTTVDYPKTTSAWYDRTAFGVPPANSGRFGNAGRGIIEGPGYVIFNAGMAKAIRFERLGDAQIGVSFVNLLNHANLGEPSLTVNNVNGGTITGSHIFPSASSARTGQLFMRWNF